MGSRRNRGPSVKILHVYKDYYPVLGGMENHIRMLAESQVDRGYDVSVLVTNLTSRTRVEYLNGVRVIKAGRIANIASTPLSLSMPFLLRRERPDITHLHFPYPPGEVAHLLLGRAPRTVLTYHSDVVRQKTFLKLYHPILKAVLKKVDRIIATSTNYVESSPYLSLFRDKCTVIPLGIDLSPFIDVAHEKVREIREVYPGPLLIFVGRLRYYKGLQYLIEAMPDMPARLLVIGTGPMEAYWKRLSVMLNVADKVLFLGEVGDESLPSFYRAADIFVLPASERSEAFGLVQVEAMVAGTPVVSTELGTGTSFVNLHNETGLVVPARDSQALRGAILELLANPALRKKLGERARERALKEFSRETMVERVTRLYEELPGC
jgi:glycosyltransferase involved in cell wall biosynthesis